MIQKGGTGYVNIVVIVLSNIDVRKIIMPRFDYGLMK